MRLNGQVLDKHAFYLVYQRFSCIFPLFYDNDILRAVYLVYIVILFLLQISLTLLCGYYVLSPDGYYVLSP